MIMNVEANDSSGVDVQFKKQRVWDKPYIYCIISFLLSFIQMIVYFGGGISEIIPKLVYCSERGFPAGSCSSSIIGLFFLLIIVTIAVVPPIVFVAIAFTKIKHTKNKVGSYWLVGVNMVFVMIALIVFLARNF